MARSQYIFYEGEKEINNSSYLRIDWPSPSGLTYATWRLTPGYRFVLAAEKIEELEDLFHAVKLFGKVVKQYRDTKHTRYIADELMRLVLRPEFAGPNFALNAEHQPHEEVLNVWRWLMARQVDICTRIQQAILFAFC